jgi:hypothetical protein
MGLHEHAGVPGPNGPEISLDETGHPGVLVAELGVFADNLV